MMRVKQGNILVKISKADRIAMFQKPVTLPNGAVVFMAIDDAEEEGFERSYAQSVSIGEVLAVGNGVEGVMPGDVVLLDYIVDMTEKFIVVNDTAGKVVSLSMLVKYRERDNIIDANRRTPHPTVDYKKGELEETTLVIAVVREGIIHAVWPYVLLKHKPLVIKYKEQENSPVWSSDVEEEVIQREVLFANNKGECKSGDIIFCENESIFERQLNGQAFDVLFEHDILASV